MLLNLLQCTDPLVHPRDEELSTSKWRQCQGRETLSCSSKGFLVSEEEEAGYQRGLGRDSRISGGKDEKRISSTQGRSVYSSITSLQHPV